MEFNSTIRIVQVGKLRQGLTIHGEPEVKTTSPDSEAVLLAVPFFCLLS